MPKTVTATEAQTRFGAIVSWALEQKDDVIVESHGVPKVAIVCIEDYQRMQAWREQERRRAAVAKLEAIADRIRQRNADLTEEEAMALADRFARETIDSMVAKGTITFAE